MATFWTRLRAWWRKPAQSSTMLAENTWTGRIRAGFSRLWQARPANLQNPPPTPGASAGTIANKRQAEQDLRRMAQSPAVFAAISRRALGLQVYPIRVSRGYGPGAVKEVLSPDRVSWVASLMMVLNRPDPADSLRIFPAHTGEMLLAQLLADLLMTGNAFVRVQLAKPRGSIIGLHRLHPKQTELVRIRGEEYWQNSPQNGPAELIPRGDVAHLRLLSWEASGRGELGTGAADPLQRLLEAEIAALQTTATTIGQGGVDIRVTGKTPVMATYLQKKENREDVANQVSEALSVTSGRRVMVVGGDLAVEDAGLKPSEIAAPNLLKTAKEAELMVIGVTPASVGSDTSTYATAVQQTRVQAELDEQLAMVMECCLLRPLAQYFARQAGGRWGLYSGEVSCWFDLSTHPGKQMIRTESLGRMKSLVELGWTAEQAAEAEGIELPPPEGQPQKMSAPAPDTTPAEPGTPPSPLGDIQAPTQEPRDYIHEMIWGRPK